MINETDKLRSEIIGLCVDLGEFFAADIRETQLLAHARFYESIITSGKYTFEQLARASELYKNHSSDKTKYPMPGQILAMITPSDETQAREAVGYIIKAIGDFGPNALDKAKALVGELGWEIVKRQGGWEEVCRILNYENQGMFQAQWREWGIGIIKKKRMGIDFKQGPNIEVTDSPIQPLGETLKKLLKDR